ncbi:unnamed protein product [Spirodela intermedia]|uniref:Glycosyltransferase n=1 Tax=Spirodela intermedia TaxID=51605 RepID=A0A7I8KZD7_SPIIN|nr:unnamed protein product [Spirodela intermedia]
MVEERLHFVLVPFVAQGHIIPTLDLARLLAERGVLVTLVTTPLNLSRNQAFVSRVKESGLPILFLTLRFPCEEIGLPAGYENMDLVPHEDEELAKFFVAMEMMREPLLLHLRRSSPQPCCIISDFCNPWTRHVARELGHNLMHHKVYEGVDSAHAPVVVPDLPVRIEVTMAQAPGIFPLPDWKWMSDEVSEAESSSHGTVVNTFASLEHGYISLYEKVKGKKVWAVGPVSLCNKLATDAASRGDKAVINEEKCLTWLDSREPRSVLYASFGTLVGYPLAQLVELGMGLEAAQRPIIWVIKAGELQSAVEEWLAEGFEERTRDRILIIRGWAPQMTILSHPSIGGFLTHCGWNSSLEGIAAGVPLLTWPGFADQFLNERFLVDVLRVGISCGMKRPFWDETVISGDVKVKREDLKKAVERLMGNGIEAHELRKRTTELRNMARCAMDVGGSSEESLMQFINEVSLLAKKQISTTEIQQEKD